MFLLCVYFFAKQSSLDEKDARDERNKKLLRSAKEKINELTGIDICIYHLITFSLICIHFYCREYQTCDTRFFHQTFSAT